LHASTTLTSTDKKTNCRYCQKTSW